MKIKMTIDLPENLLVAAKKQAAKCRTTLHALIERGLRAELRGAGQKAKTTKIKRVTVDGGLPHRLVVTDRAAMMNRIGRRP